MISSGFGSGSGSYLSSHSESGSGSYPKTRSRKITNDKNFYRFYQIFLGNTKVVYDDVIQKFIKCIDKYKKKFGTGFISGSGKIIPDLLGPISD